MSSPEQGSSPAPPGATLPTTSPPGAGWQQCTRAQHPTAGSVRAHRPTAGRPGAACASGPRKIPSILQPASTATAGTVPGCTPLAPGLPHLQSLQSLGALGTRRAAGRALGGKNKHVLGCGRAVPRHCCPKDKLTCVGSRPGDAGTHRSQHHCILGPCSPPPAPVTKLLMHFGPVQRMLSQLLVSRKSGEVMAALTKKSALPSSPWMCPGGPCGERDHQRPWEQTSWGKCGTRGGGVCPPNCSTGWSSARVDTHGFPWRAWGTPRAVGSWVTLGKNPKERGFRPGWAAGTARAGRERGDEAPGTPAVTLGTGTSLAMNWGADGAGGPGCRC